MVGGTALLFVKGNAGMVEPPLLVLNPVIVAGTFGADQVMLAPLVGEVMVTVLEMFCEQMV